MAIIRMAMMDYEKARWKKNEIRMGEIKRFFYSEWFMQLSEYNGPALFNQIEQNVNQYGTSMPYKLDGDEKWGE